MADEAEPLRQGGCTLFSFGGRVPFCGHLDAEIASSPDGPVPRSAREGVQALDEALLVYTSGTTGLPKAATITHLRFFSMAKVFVTVFGIRHDDRIYCVLPLYHSAGGLCGVGMVMLTGATMVLRRRFSASAFWPDVRTHRCTVVQYIGELCRYLLNQPPRADDAKNRVRDRLASAATATHPHHSAMFPLPPSRSASQSATGCGPRFGTNSSVASECQKSENSTAPPRWVRPRRPRPCPSPWSPSNSAGGPLCRPRATPLCSTTAPVRRRGEAWAAWVPS